MTARNRLIEVTAYTLLIGVLGGCQLPEDGPSSGEADSASSPGAGHEYLEHTPPPESNDADTEWDEPGSSGRRYGPEQQLGNGTVRTFTKFAHHTPLAVGVVMTDAALDNLSSDTSDWPWNIYDDAGVRLTTCCGRETLLQFPEEAGSQPFKHVVLNWMPTGHGPVGVHDRPHLDVHFYLVDVQERLSIPLARAAERCVVNGAPAMLDCENYALATAPLPDDASPPGFVDIGAARPGMGNHLYDLTRPEHHGAMFEETFLFGKHAGKLTFFEPMITRQFLLELKKPVCRTVAMPQAMAEAGWYPTRYCMRRDLAKHEIEVRLDRFKRFEKTNGVVTANAQ